jgi:hypothetical protein
MVYHYNNLLERLNFLTHFDPLFLINIFRGTKCCPYVLETVDLRVPSRNIRKLTSSLALLATSLQPDVFQPQMQCVNLQLFLEIVVWVLKV